MKMRRIISILLTIIILLSISISSFASDNSQNNSENITEDVENTNDLNSQKSETEQKIEETNKQIEYVKTEISNAILEIQELDDKIKEQEQQNEQLKERLKNLEVSVKETTENLEVITTEYNEKNELLKERLVTLYEEGDMAYLEVLLSARSLSEFLSIYYAMVEIAEYDNALIDKVGEQKKQIELSKRKLDNETAEIKLLKVKAEQNETILKNTKSLMQGQIQVLSDQEKELNDKIQEYKKDMAMIEAKIQELNQYTGDINIQYTGGIMIWPVAASGTRITSYYGTREHPIEGIVKFHQGLDIGSVGFGAPVVAVLDGVVTYAGELGSYGNCVMVYHGDGITTLYGHGQEILAKKGDEVKQGDVIMKTGSTGNSTGPHLHFEVRINGSTANPLNYVQAP